MGTEARGTRGTHSAASGSATGKASRAHHPTEGMVALRVGGVSVCIRAIRPDDGPRLVAFHGGLSPETLHRRYFRRVGPLTPKQADTLARVDGRDHMALVAATGPERDAPILAVARYDRLDADAAEMGLVVADAWQARGIGSALFARLVAHARACGITTMHAATQTDNLRVLAMARHAGYPCSARLDALEVELRLDIRSPIPTP